MPFTSRDNACFNRDAPRFRNLGIILFHFHLASFCCVYLHSALEHTIVSIISAVSMRTCQRPPQNGIWKRGAESPWRSHGRAGIGASSLGRGTRSTPWLRSHARSARAMRRTPRASAAASRCPVVRSAPLSRNDPGHSIPSTPLLSQVVGITLGIPIWIIRTACGTSKAGNNSRIKMNFSGTGLLPDGPAGQENATLSTPRLDADDFARRFAVRASSLMWFLGAGASAAAGVPTAVDMTWQFKQALFVSQRKVSRHTVADLSNPLVRERLQQHADGLGNLPAAGTPNEYAAFFEATYPSAADRRSHVQAQLASARPSYGHMALASLMKAGHAPIVWTTNFDTMIADACAAIYETTASLTTATLDAPEVAEQAELQSSESRQNIL